MTDFLNNFADFSDVVRVKKNQDFVQPLVAFPISNISSEEAGRAQFNLATATYATVAYSAVWFINKTHLKLLQEGFNVEPQRIFG